MGTRDNLWFLTGDTFAEMARQRIADVGVVPGSVTEVPTELISMEGRERPDIPSDVKVAITMLTNMGIVACLPGGEVFNLTETVYQMPSAMRAAPILRRQDGMNTLVTSQDSGGTPAQSARFGDYLSAELIRANGIG